jgi:cysteine desulfuration protein SufE
VIEEFELFDDWMQKYEHIIELGKDLPLIDEQYKVEDNLIKGCQSRVWVWGEVKDGKMNFSADSDAIITKGIIALLIRVLNHRTPAEVVQAELNFIKAIGLQEHLSPTRANGLLGMVKQIKSLAVQHLND